jgi:hypothetical protein
MKGTQHSRTRHLASQRLGKLFGLVEGLREGLAGASLLMQVRLCDFGFLK